MSGCLAEIEDKTVEGTDCFMECVCYGLGNFSSSVSARYQLAMLLLLLDALQVNLLLILKIHFYLNRPERLLVKNYFLFFRLLWSSAACMTLCLQCPNVKLSESWALMC